MSSAFKEGLQLSRSAMADYLARRGHARRGGAPDDEEATVPAPKHPNFKPGIPCQAVLKMLHQAVLDDIFCYQGTKEDEAPSLPLEEEDEVPLEAPLEQENKAHVADLAAQSGEKEQESSEEQTGEDSDEAESPPTLQLHAVVSDSVFANTFYEQVEAAFEQPVPEHAWPDEDVVNNMTRAEKRLYNLWQRELLAAEDHPVACPPVTIQRMQKALDTFVAKRPGDAVTLLKSARADDSQNPSLSFVLSQLQYYRVYQGVNECLPEAREEGIKACTTNEKVLPETNQRYRYYTIATERAFSAERAMDMMRKYYLLTPENLTGPEGLASHHCVPLKTIILLSMIPIKYWQTYEVDAVCEIARKTIGGALLYLFFFQPGIRKVLDSRRDFFQKIRDLEKDLAKSQMIYEQIRGEYEQYFSENGALTPPPALYWTVHHRYLKTFLAAAPMPEYEEVLMFTSLDGRRFSSKAYPNTRLKEMGLLSTNYWQTWGASITPDDGDRLQGRIPCAEVGELGPLLHQYENLLQTMENQENKLIDHEKWPLIQSYLPDYTLDSFYEWGTGKTIPASLRAPTDLFFRVYHQAWAGATPPAKRPSQLIRHHAASGAFASPQEIQSIMDGVEWLFEDEEHGFGARLKEAWQKYEYNSMLQRRASRRFAGEGVGEHLREFWWFYSVVVPLAVMTFFVIASAGDYRAALRLVGTFLVVVAICGLIVYAVFNVNRQD